MIKQKSIKIKTTSSFLTYAEIGDIVCNSDSDITITLPIPGPGLWYRIINVGSGKTTILYNSVQNIVFQNQQCLCLANGSIAWFYGRDEIDKKIKKSISFYIDGNLNIGVSQLTIISPESMIIKDIRLTVDEAPAGANLIIDINKNGSTIYTAQVNRPTIIDGGVSSIAYAPNITSLSLGDKVSLDIDQIGSSFSGKNLSIIIICEVI